MLKLKIKALTANVQGGVLDDCIARGMDDVLSKPVDFDNLSKILQVYLPKLDGSPNIVWWLYFTI